MHLAGRPVRATELHQNISWRGRIVFAFPAHQSLGGDVSVGGTIRAARRDARCRGCVRYGPWAVIARRAIRNPQSQANRGNGKWAMAGRIGRLDEKVARSGLRRAGTVSTRTPLPDLCL